MPAHNSQLSGMVNVHWSRGVHTAPACNGAATGFPVSTSCYHGYERVSQALATASNHEPMELDYEAPELAHSLSPVHSRKRCGDDSEAPRVKRLREEEQKENVERVEMKKSKEVEWTEKKRDEDIKLEQLLWSTHGASWFQLQVNGTAL